MRLVVVVVLIVVIMVTVLNTARMKVVISSSLDKAGVLEWDNKVEELAPVPRSTFDA